MKFSEHSKKILAKCNYPWTTLDNKSVNDMSTRIDDLEKSLEKVLAQDESPESAKP